MNHGTGILTERKIQAQVLKYLRGLKGAKFFKIIMANEAGCPDIVGVYIGRFVAFELKRPGGKLTKIQAKQMELLAEAGALVYKVESLAEVIVLLEQIADRKTP